MATLTDEQLNKIQEGIDDVRGKINALPLSPSGNISADAINPQPIMQINELAGQAPDLSSAFSYTASAKTAADLKAKRIKEIEQRMAETEKQSASIWDKISGAKPSSEVAREAGQEIGFDTGEYLLTRQSDIAEMENLQSQYNDMANAKNEALLRIEERPQTLRSLEGHMTAEEKRWNLRMQALAGQINTKAAIMQLKDENYTMAVQHINQAVANATAELNLKIQQFDKLKEDNKDLFNDLGDEYKAIYDTAEKFALQEYQMARDEKIQIGNLMAEYPDAPWTANSMSLSLGEATQVAQRSARYQLELQSQQADISKTYYDMMPDKMAETSGDILTDAQNVFSGVLDKSKLSTKDNYASKVMAEVAKLRQEALDRGDFYGLMASSGGGKEPSEAAILAIEKASNVVYQIDGLQEIFNNEKEQKTFASEVKRLTGVDISPAWGKLRSFNPYDKDAQSIKASLQAIVPTLARGIYGEVGVLTDYDVKNYIKTLPTLSSTEDVRKMVLGITIRTIQRSIENKIKSNVAAGRDMSGYKDMYQEVKSVTAKLLGEELTSSGEGVLSDQEAYEEYLKMQQ